MLQNAFTYNPSLNMGLIKTAVPKLNFIPGLTDTAISTTPIAKKLINGLKLRRLSDFHTPVRTVSECGS